MQHKSIVLAERDSPVRLFFARFSESPEDLEVYKATLSSDELAKVEKKSTPLLRRQALLSFGFRREALAKILAVNPQALKFSHTEKDKPMLTDQPGFFNVSHSDDFWVLVYHPSCLVGVDIEVEERAVDRLTIAKRFFHPEESAQLEKKPELFWHYWTAKEAILKAMGAGITYGLDRIHLSLNEAGQLENPDWKLATEKLFEGTLSAVAISSL